MDFVLEAHSLELQKLKHIRDQEYKTHHIHWNAELVQPLQPLPLLFKVKRRRESRCVLLVSLTSVGGLCEEVSMLLVTGSPCQTGP